MYTYEVVKENKKEPSKSIIEMGGLKNRFTVQDVKDHLEYVRKSLRETVAQIDVFAKQDQLVIRTSDELKKITESLPKDEGELKMIEAFINRKITLPQYQQLVKECNKTIKDYEERLKDIEKATGIKPEVKVQELIKDVKPQKRTK